VYLNLPATHPRAFSASPVALALLMAAENDIGDVTFGFVVPVVTSPPARAVVHDRPVTVTEMGNYACVVGGEGGTTPAVLLWST
jgi:hypothetical protein